MDNMNNQAPLGGQPNYGQMKEPDEINLTGEVRQEKHVNLSKNTEQQSTFTENNSNEQYFRNIDMQKVHNTEQEVENQLEQGINKIGNVVDQGMQKVNNGFNNMMNKAGQIGQIGQQNMYQQGTNQQQNMYQQGTNQFNNQTNMGQINMVTPDKLSVQPGLAAGLSVLVTGLGQMLNGQVAKGVTMLGVTFVGMFIISLITCGLGLIAAPVVWILSALDAYNCAKILQSGRPIGVWEFHFFG